MEIRRALLLLWAGASNAVNPLDDVLAAAILPPSDHVPANRSSTGQTALAAEDIGAPAEASAPAEKGDPIFKHNGTSTHFWIKAGVSTPLLKWPSHDGMNALELSGKTFARKATGDQWFKELVVAQGETTVVRVSAEDPGELMRSLCWPHDRRLFTCPIEARPKHGSHVWSADARRARRRRAQPAP